MHPDAPEAIDPAAALAEPAADAAAVDEGPDPLLECLAFLTRYHGRPKSISVLMSGLPVSGDRITVAMFQRAAARAGLEATPIKRRLGRIHAWTVPAVIMLDQGDAAVLVERKDDGICTLVLPEAGDATTEIALSDLEKRYSGYAILVKPAFRFTGRDEGVALAQTRSWFWGTLAENWWTYAQVVVASVLINLFALANPMFTMIVYDRVLPNNAVETAVVLAAGVGIVLLFDFILKNLRGWFIDFMGRRADVILACRIFDHVLDLKISHRPKSSGAFASMLREFESVRGFFTSATLAAFIDLPFAILFVGVIALINVQLGIFLAVVVVVVLLWGLIIQIPIARSVRTQLAQGEHKHGVLVESLSGIETIKVVGAEGRMRSMWERVVGENAALGQRTRLFNNLGINFVQVMQQGTAIMVVPIGVFLVKDGLLTAGGLIASVILSGRAIGPMAQVVQLMMRFHQASGSLKSLNRLMESPVELPAEATFVHRPTLGGLIAFQNVNFAYLDTTFDVLRDLSFAIAPGERVGIIGRVGSGKSTIAKLLVGLYAPASGAVLLDGTDLRQIEPSDTRSNIGFVPQDLFLFRGTIKENIAIAKPHAGDDEIAAVVEAVGLKDFISGHPLGYDLPVGERGDGLSGGQRQAVALARALLKRPSVLVLDEPTSSMDTTSEKHVIDALPAFMRDKTIVLITHRVSLLQLVDRLIVLDQGRVVADGLRQDISTDWPAAASAPGGPMAARDIDYMSDLRAAMSRRPSVMANLLLFAIVAFFVCATVWAAVTEVDQVSTGDGRVMPSRRVQVVQNLEGGIVSALNVREGDVVTAGQVLMQLDETRFRSEFSENRMKFYGLQAVTTRLEAEVAGTALSFPPELESQFSQIVAGERNLYGSRADGLRSGVARLQAQLAQHRQEIAETEARIEQLERSIKLAREEIAILEPLVKKGINAPAELIRLRREEGKYVGDLKVARESIIRQKAAIRELEEEIKEVRARFRSRALEELNEARVEMEALRQNLASREGRLTRTVIRAPVDGIIKQLFRQHHRRRGAARHGPGRDRAGRRGPGRGGARPAGGYRLHPPGPEGAGEIHRLRLHDLRRGARDAGPYQRRHDRRREDRRELLRHPGDRQDRGPARPQRRAFAGDPRHDGQCGCDHRQAYGAAIPADPDRQGTAGRVAGKLERDRFGSNRRSGCSQMSFDRAQDESS